MLQVWLLGRFDVQVDGKRTVIPSRAAQSLLAFLILNAGAAHRREKLAGMLWPEMTDENARRNLRHELWRIRKAITDPQSSSEYLVAEEFTIGFNARADYWLDVTQLERAPADAATSELISQVNLYHGELLPGFYDDWVGLERERVQTLFERRMQLLIERLLAEQQWNHVLEWGERWIALGQTPEPAYRALMVAYSASGDPAKAALAYDRCVEALKNDLGLEPSAETRALFEELTLHEKPTHPTLTPLTPVLIQPSGTVTFLVTDIQGSTQLLERLGNEYANLLADQRDLLRATAEKHNGHEVDTQGDAFFFAFFRAADAVAFAADAQRALATHHWPQDAALRVRMGLHTGEPMLARTGYVGMDVHRAARIGGAGHGGQVLLSQTTSALVENELPPGTGLKDLGEHKLKDLRYPVHIVQLTIQGLPSDFPPLKTLDSGTQPPAPGEPPYKGLQYFDESDAGLFFGREAVVAKLARDLSENRFLAVVVGASGSGKSSVVRAGLIPALRTDNSPGHLSGWQIYMVTPTAHPLEALATALTRDQESVTATATLLDDLAREPRSLYLYLKRFLIPTLSDQGNWSAGARRVLLVVDQFEELFTLCRDEFEREAFIDNLLTAIAPASPSVSPDRGEARNEVTLVVTIRADFYAHLAQYPELRDLVAKQQEYIGPMTVEELRRAIEEPAKGGGWEFEPGLVDLMLRDVGDEPGALPLLSHALLETWKRRSGHTMTLKGYHDAGGVRGAIAQTAETTYQQLTPEQQAIARNIFLRLTELGEGTDDTRRRASLDELIPRDESGAVVRTVLTQLADARLVTTGEGTAEVAHEALIREWPRLRDWLNEDREGLRLHRQLTEAAHEWDLLERDSGALYRGTRLTQVQELAADNPTALNEQERAFLSASVENAKREEQEKEEARQRELQAAQKLVESSQQLADEQKQRAEEQTRAAKQLRRRAYFLASAFVLALVLAGIALFFGNQANDNAITAQQNAFAASQAQATAVANADVAQKAQADAVTQRDTAQQQGRIATARELAASAITNLSVDPERSILLALQAVNTTAPDNMVIPEAEAALHRAILGSHLEKTLTGHTVSVIGVAYSPDGSRIATQSPDGTVKVWDPASGKQLFSVPISPDNGIGLSFNKAGTLLAMEDFDKHGTEDQNQWTIVLKVWDAHSGNQVRSLPLPIHLLDSGNPAYDADLKRVANGLTDGTTQVYDAETGKLLLTLSKHDGYVWLPAFSPDGKLIATASFDNTAKVWDAATGKLLQTFSNSDRVRAVDFSPNSKELAAATQDGFIRVWDLATGAELHRLDPQLGILQGVRWSHDGTMLAEAGNSPTAVVWNAQSGRELYRLEGHAVNINDVAFSPDDKHLVTTSDDITAKLWALTAPQELLTIPLANWGKRVVYSPDGTRLLFGLDTGSAEVRDATTGNVLLTLPGHKGTVFGVAFNADGSKIVTNDQEGTLRVWESATGKELLTVKGPTNLHGPSTPLYPVAFSPDRSRIAAGNLKGAQVFDAAIGQVLFTAKLVTVPGLDTNVVNVAFSPDGRVLAVTTNANATQLFNSTTGEVIETLQASDLVWGLAFSPAPPGGGASGTRLATGNSDGTTQVWDAATGKELLNLARHAGIVYGIAFSPDGMRLATVGADGVIKLWESTTGKELLSYGIDNSSLFSVMFSPDGKHLLVGHQHGVYILALDLDELKAIAHARLTRTWTVDECKTFLHMDQCPPSQ